MNKLKKAAAAVLCVLAVLTAAACKPVSAAETEQERAYYEKIYATEPAPEGDVARLLELLDTCVGGQYIIAGQGTPITREFVETMAHKYPDYFDGGRLEYFLEIADRAEQEGHSFPEDYAWDCSGLWWYAVNELGLYDKYIDRTAHDTYHDYCTPITKDELRPGDLVFYEDPSGKVIHMGIVGSHGYIYEAVSGYVGVVLKRTVDRRAYENVVAGGVLPCKSWNLFGRPKIFN